MDEERIIEDIKRHLANRLLTSSRFTEEWINELEIILGLEPHDPKLHEFMIDPNNKEWWGGR